MFISGQSSGFHPCERQENPMGTRENRVGTLAAWHRDRTEAQRFG
jgi:hypothetical protein